MKTTTTKVSEFTIHQDELIGILRQYAVDRYGDGWAHASVSVREVLQPVTMGQIDDCYETTAFLTLTEVDRP